MFLTTLVGSLSENKAVQALVYVALLTGVYKLTTFTLSLGALVADLFVLPATNYKKYGAGQGKWAVVTGASDGIGKQFAMQLAQKKFNVVLVSRTLSKLESLASEIEATYGVQTAVVAFDASVDSEENYAKIHEAIADVAVSVLVNNVGQSHVMPVPFVETDTKELTDIVTINNIVTLKITQTVLPLITKTVLAEKKSGLRGLVLTMGSFGGLVPTPYLATYSGSKAFLQQWSTSLAGEMKPLGVDVELLISYLVTTEMSKIRRASAIVPTPKQFVAATLRSAGRRCGAQERYATSTPFWTHALMHFAIENSVGIHSSIVNKVNGKMHLDIRARALRKAARQKKD